MGTPITDPLEDAPPQALQERTIYVGAGGINTVRLMHDPFDPTSRWFQGPPSKGTQVAYLVNGQDTFKAFLEAIRTATGPGHFVYLLGWQLDIDQALEGTDASTSMRSLMTRAAAAGVQVRAMLWRNSQIVKSAGNAHSVVINGVTVPVPYAGPQVLRRTIDDSVGPWNLAEVKAINEAMPGDAAAILDTHTPLVGSHHQKVLIVHGSQGLLAFCGGVDIARNRLTQLYDVHCRLKGEGAHNLLAIFRERWQDHPESKEKDALPGRKTLLAFGSLSVDTTEGRQHVQVARTYARDQRYLFAFSGSTELWLQLRRAIQQARKFIYMENQYFTSEDLAQVLASALPRLEHLTILIQCASDMRSGFHKTKRCVDILRRAGGSKVRVFTLPTNPTDPPRNYVHTKTWIFDDEVAIIGTANATRRSFTCDSEANTQIYDPSREDRPAWRFARRLRVRLWSNLLNMNTPAGHAELADGVASVVHWDNRPAGSLVVEWEPLFKEPIDESAGEFYIKPSDLVWDEIIDPFKSQIGP